MDDESLGRRNQILVREGDCLGGGKDIHIPQCKIMDTGLRKIEEEFKADVG